MGTSHLALTDSIHEGRRPTRVENPPARGEIKKLRDRLLTYGRDDGRPLTESACQFLSENVVAPATVRSQLNRPSLRPTATGYLEVIHATVPVDALIPDPGNGRVVGATAWPAADQSAGQTLKLWAPSDLLVHPDSGCEVFVQADTITDFKTVLEEAAEKTKQLNPKMRGKIERDGILDPLLCQLMHVRTADGFSGIALVTRDGSTRCSFAKEIHRSMPYDALFGPLRDLDQRRQRWIEMKRRYEGPAHELTVEEMHQLRTYLVDVQIVIGFVSHNEHVTVLEAVDDIVRRTHVETSLPWLPVAQNNSQADQILAALRSGDVLSTDQFLLYGGKLSREERVAARFPAEPDCVLADLLQVFGATKSSSVNDPLHKVMRRGADGVGQIRDIYKATWVGSLGLRQFNVEGRSLDVANTTLEEGLRVEAIWDKPWVNTKRSPAALRDAALAELEGTGEPGPACRELLVKAVGHLAAQGWLKPTDPGGQDRNRDQRQPNVVLDAMHKTPLGVHVLAEALAAGRRGADARALTEDGETFEQGGGDPMLLSNIWIRKQFKEFNGVENDAPDGKAIPQTAREQVAGQLRKAEGGIATLRRALESAASVEDEDGNPFLERYGWTGGELHPLAEELRGYARQLESYAVRAEVVRNLPPAVEDQLGIEDVLEGQAA
jgi:hypothetical protein